MMIDSRTIIGLSNDSVRSNGYNIRQLLDNLIFYSTPRNCEVMILRKFDTSKLTEYWDEEKQEAVGGYKYEYTDYLIPARTSWYGRGTDVESLRMIGQIGFEQPYIHLRYDTNPSNIDIIFSLNPQVDLDYNGIPLNNIYTQYNITRVVPYRDINGRIEFFTCLVKEEQLDAFIRS